MRALNQITKLQLLKYRARLSDIPIDIWQKIQKFADSSFALVIEMSKTGDSTTLVMHMPSCKHPLEDRDSGLSITNNILRFLYQNSGACFSDTQIENMYKNMKLSLPLPECSYAMVDIKDDDEFGNGNTHKVARFDARWNLQLEMHGSQYILDTLLDACFRDFHFTTVVDFYTSSSRILSNGDYKSEYQWHLLVMTQPKRPHQTSADST